MFELREGLAGNYFFSKGYVQVQYISLKAVLSYIIL